MVTKRRQAKKATGRRSAAACALCRRPFKWHRWRHQLDCCGITVCSTCSSDCIACEAEGHVHHHVPRDRSMCVPLPERMRRGDFEEVPVCKPLGEKVAREILDDPVLRGAKVAHDKGFKAGYEEGHRVGYEKGLQEGYDQGYRAGCEKGQQEGYDQGYRKGHADGED